MSVLSRLLDLLANALDETADSMAAAIRAEFPAYRCFPDRESEDAWRGGLRRTLQLFVQVASANRKLTVDERSDIGAIGGTRAEQGLPLEVVQGSVRIGMHVVLCSTRRLAADLTEADGFEDAFEELSLRATRFVNAFSDVLSKGYVTRSEARATTLERDRAQFGSDLLAGAYPIYEDVATHAETLGLLIPRRLGLALLPASRPAHSLLAADLGRTLARTLVVPIGLGGFPHTVLLVPAATDLDWREAREQVARVAGRYRVTALLAGPCEEPVEWHARYEEAAAVAHLVTVFADGRNTIDMRELISAQFVAGATPVALQAIEREVLLPLRTHSKGKKLLLALHALMRMEGSAKAAALVLGVTPDTVRTYKATIEEATGLCFEYPADATRLGLAWLVLVIGDGDPLCATPKTLVEPAFSR